MTQVNTIQINSKFYLQWHLTDRCNLRCTHCYQESYSDVSELPGTELKEIAEGIFTTLSKWNKKADISLTGGEPFIRKDIFDFVDYLNNSKFVNCIDILTNGTLINDNLILKIKTYSKLKYIQISLDGASAQTHDKIRGIGTFKKTINIIRKLKENQIEVRIMFTLQNCNKNDIPSLIDLALNEKIDGLTIERIVPMGASKDAMEVSLSKQEIKEIYQYISDRADSEYNKGNKLRILKYRPLWVLIDPCRLSDGSNLHKESGAICSIGLDGICILPDATVLACRRLPISIGNLKNDSLEKIWTTSELLWEIADKTNLKGKCKSCEYISKCSGCRAMAYAYTGDYLCEDPHCWLK